MVKDYKGEATVAAGEAFDTSPSNIESRTAKTDLASGLKIALLPKKTRGGTVVLTLTLRFGDLKSLTNRALAADFAGQMLMRGTTKHTRQQIKDEFDKLKAKAFVFGGAESAGASIETVRENLPAAIRLLGEILREPAFPQSEFDLLKQEEIADVESQKGEPQAGVLLAFSRHMSPYPKNDPRGHGTPDERIAELKGAKLEDAKKFYSDFYGASNGELGVVGDFDRQEIEKLVTELFGDWKSPKPYTRLQSEFKDVAAVNQTIETPD